MKHKVSLITAALLAINLGASPCRAEEPQETAAESGYPDRYQSYLDAVRAQRQSRREERTKAMQEAAENRRRLIDPWGDSRRQAMENRSKWHQEDLIEHRRWSHPESELIKEQHDQQLKARQAQAEAKREQMEKYRKEREQRLPPPRPTPSYWDNRWYYQGY